MMSMYDAAEEKKKIVELEAKLAMVKEWWSLVGYMNEYDCKVIDPTEGGDLERILSDTEPPLAVVDGWATPRFMDDPWQYNDEGFRRKTLDIHPEDRGWKLPVTNIVMARKEA